MKLTNLINEKWLQDEKAKSKLSKSDKAAFLEAVAKYNEYGKAVYREHSLEELCETIGKIVESAGDIIMTESDSFDNIVISRHMKGLTESMKLFEKTAKEANALQQRLEHLYEDMGSTLGKYFEIKEAEEPKLDAPGKEDKDIDNDGDHDEADKYIDNKRDAIEKSMEEGQIKLSTLMKMKENGTFDRTKKKINEEYKAHWSVEHGTGFSAKEWVTALKRVKGVKAKTATSGYHHHTAVICTVPDKATAAKAIKALRNYSVRWPEVSDFEKV